MIGIKISSGAKAATVEEINPTLNRVTITPAKLGMKNAKAVADIADIAINTINAIVIFSSLDSLCQKLFLI